LVFFFIGLCLFFLRGRLGLWQGNVTFRTLEGAAGAGKWQCEICLNKPDGPILGLWKKVTHLFEKIKKEKDL
jgi:hypothetical protein